MRIWTTEHVFQDPWDIVVRAQWRKYPNQFNKSVEGIDVVDRFVDPNGVLKSHRIVTSCWSIPGWAKSIIPEGHGHASEHSKVDPTNKVMEMKTRNLNFCNIITIDEKLVYSQHPEDKRRTQLKQESIVTVKIPFAGYLESVVVDTISKNALKGRQAMEHMIEKIKTETTELQYAARYKMESFNQFIDADHRTV